MLLGLELVENKGLKGLGFGWSGELAVTDFLESRLSAVKVLRQSQGTSGQTLTLPIMSLLTGLKATEPMTSGDLSDGCFYEAR